MSRKNKKKNRDKKKRYVSVFTWAAILLAGVATLLCALFFVLGYCMNAYYVSEASKGKYHPEMEKFFMNFHFPNEYIIWYNIGNYYFDEEEYEEAEEYYLKAIECGIPYEKECPVKVNLALAMMGQLSDDEWDEFFYSISPELMSASARKVEKTLKEAIEVLTEDGCAAEDEDEEGHNEEAQQLKEEIEELLENAGCSGDEEDEEEDQGEEEEDEEDEQEPDDGDEEEDEDSSSLDEEEIMEHIQQQLDENQAERTDDQQFYENYYGYGNEDGSGTVEIEYGEVW